jgi:hypothetical protein
VRSSSLNQSPYVATCEHSHVGTSFRRTPSLSLTINAGVDLQASAH